MRHLLGRGIEAAVELFAPIQEVKSAHKTRIVQGEKAASSKLSDYERMLIAMHEYPEALPEVQHIAELVEAGELPEQIAQERIAFLALCNVIKDVTE